jgi:drug/metabolite transporter (DMT)-like permease
VALLLEYLAPVLIVGWLWARHRQAPRRLTLLGVTLAVLGLLLVLDLTGGARISLVGVAWGLVAAVCLVLYFLLAARTEDALPPIALAGGGLVVGAVVLGAAGLIGVLDVTAGAATVTVGASAVPWWVPILVVSLVAAAFAYVAGVAAVRMLGAKVSSFVALTEVLFAIVFAWLVLGELPMPVQLLGGVLIIAGLVAVRADESRAVRAARSERHTDDGGRVPVGVPD